eukprot:m.281809 g.281809  ORF g.281809 m.281809 type:complete len:93 (-) comp17743_c0_seq8:172-450(-)
MEGNLESIQAMLKSRAAPLAGEADPNGATPADLARRHGNHECEALLTATLERLINPGESLSKAIQRHHNGLRTRRFRLSKATASLRSPIGFS